LYYSTREKKSFHPPPPAPAWFLSLSSLQPDPRVAISLSPSLPALPKPLAFLRRRGAPIRSPEGAPPRFASCLDAVVVGDPAPITALRRGGRAWRHGDGAAGLMRRPRCRTPRRISAAPGRAPWSATSSRFLPRPAPPPFALHYIHAAFTFRFLVFVYWVGCGVQRIGARGQLTGTNLQVTGTGTCFACSPRELPSRRAAQLGRRGGSGRVSHGSVGNRCCFFSFVFSFTWVSVPSRLVRARPRIPGACSLRLSWPRVGFGTATTFLRFGEEMMAAVTCRFTLLGRLLQCRRFLFFGLREGPAV
jgi:hypothetical protein